MTTILGVIFYFVLLPASGSDNSPQDIDITRNLEFYSSAVRPQKVYLHLDKTSYHAGQTIWFKAYLIDGITHVPDTTRTNLYVELINSEGKAMLVRVLLTEKGGARGDMQLNTSLPDGNYILRAYTDWMRNSGEEYYFTKYLYIENSGYENMIPRLGVTKNKLFNRKIDRMGNNYEIAFFPEGGDLLTGTYSRVAFQVVDLLGRGQNAEGEITSLNGDVVVSFATEFPGIGVFDFKPVIGESYKARISINGERWINHDFPQPKEEGYGLRIDNEGEKVRIRLTATAGRENPLYTDEVIIVGHTRGIPHFAQSFLIDGNKLETLIEKNMFPSGIAHFTVFTKDHLPVAERLVFIDRDDELLFYPSIETISQDGMNYVDLYLTVKDGYGNPVDGTFSLSAVDGQPDEKSHISDILSYILFSSDLEGMIGDPWFYSNAPEIALHADHLLLTYGWRRFKWEDVLAGQIPEMRYSAEPGLTVAGRLVDPARNESLNNYPVRLMIKSGHDDHYTVNTSRKGMFAFAGLFYDGIINMELSSRRLPANYPPAFELNIQDARGLEFKPGIYTRKQNITQRGDNWRRLRGVADSPYSSSTERKVNPQLFGVPDQTIYVDYETSTERSLYDLLRNRATGLSFEGGQIIIRGPSSLYNNNEARFMVDGMFVDRNAFFNLYPREIERIEIFRGTSAAIFGVRGGTGVILAYTRKPAYRGLEDVLELSMLGYHETREFYSDLISIPGITISKAPERTVYWKPDLYSGEDGVVKLRLPLNHAPERLRFRIEGAGFGGGLGFAQFAIDRHD